MVNSMMLLIPLPRPGAVSLYSITDGGKACRKYLLLCPPSLVVCVCLNVVKMMVIIGRMEGEVWERAEGSENKGLRHRLSGA